MSRPIPIRNAWHMLLYAWDLGVWTGRWDAAAETSPDLLGLLARVLVDATRPLLRRELGRAFVPRRETIAGVKGRIDFARSLKQMTFEAGRAHCSFAALDVDTPRNRILLATLTRLARDPRVAHHDRRQTETLRHELREAAALMSGVTLVRLTNASFSQLTTGRADRAFALPLAVCALVHRLGLPTEAAGTTALAGLVDDEINFPKLFESFLRNFWRHRLGGHTVAAERLDWNDALDNPLVPVMQTDIVLTERSAGKRRLVVDAKFYKSALAPARHGVRKLRTAHLYQMYAYLRSQVHRGVAFDNAEGLLLYPTTDGLDEEAICVQGHCIRFATVDLSRSWQEIEDRLVKLATLPSLA